MLPCHGKINFVLFIYIAKLENTTGIEMKLNEVYEITTKSIILQPNLLYCTLKETENSGPVGH